MKSAIGSRKAAGRGHGRVTGRLLGLAAGVAAISIVGSLATRGAAQPGPGGPIWLDQNWTQAQRDAYHHQSQGTVTLPIPATWFLNLQQPDVDPGAGLFSDQAYLDRFGFIPSAGGPANPDNLPIGFARTRGADPRDGKPIDAIGFTCAACHTGRIAVGAQEILIDGGPAITNLAVFGKKLADALALTLAVPTRFERFATRLYGPGHLLDRARLRVDMTKVAAQGLGQLFADPGGVEEGYGRLDALNRIGNKVFGEGLGIGANNARTDAPVAYPHIWDTAWFDWVQYNGSIRQPMVRNAGEAMGVGGLVNYKNGPTPPFTSTIPIDALHDRIEGVLGGTDPLAGSGFNGLRPPRWPEAVLGRIDPQLAGQGQALYAQHCEGCHGAAPNTPAFWTSNRWQAAPDTAGHKYLAVPNIPIAHIGTDPAQAQKMIERTVLVPTALGLQRGTPAGGGMQRYSYADALAQMVEKVANRWYGAQTPPLAPADRDRMNGYRANLIRGELAYKARPLDGIWATPPYLHNGSVLTLWELLSPYAERRTSFALGGRQYDVQRVGYLSGGGFTMDTSAAGNRNTGHLFETPADPAHPQPGIIGPTLTLGERAALVEYLKTL